MKILLLSAYDAESHRYWREGISKAFSEHCFVQLALPPRFFSWRVRGASLHISKWLAALPDRVEEFDLLIVTSMVDLSVLRGLCSELAKIPTLLYFHENQFAFPLTGHAQPSIEPALVSIYSAIAAEKVCFNSEYNRQSFLSGAERLLKKFPDYVPEGLVKEIADKSEVLPVALSNDVFSLASRACKGIEADNKQGHIVWNHRWEYDKGPGRLYQLVKALPEHNELQFHIVGQAFKKVPEPMKQLRSLLEARGWLGRWGRVENREDYLALLKSSSVVLSTALHDFQGLAVQEAMALGCEPVVPNRLAYTEYVKAEHRYLSEYQGDDAKGGLVSDPPIDVNEARAGAQQVLEAAFGKRRWLPSEYTMDEYSWKQLKPRYAACFSSLSRR